MPKKTLPVPAASKSSKSNIYKNRNHGKKSTKAETNRRIFAMYGKMLGGADRQTLLRYGAETWGLSTRQIEDYMTSARRWMSEAQEESKDKELSKSVAQRLDLYFQALDEGNITVCHEIRKDLDKLRGLYPSEKLKLTGMIKTEAKSDVTQVLDTKIDGTNKTLAEIVRDAYRNKAKK